MAKISIHEAETFKALARKMFFSGATVEHFLESATPTQLSAASNMITFELKLRKESKIKKLMRKADFPYLKTLETFDYSDVVFPDEYTKEDIESLEFIKCAEDFVFFGKSGRGKTHEAIALGLKSVQSGQTVRFFNTAELVDKLTKAAKEDRVDTLLKDIAKADLVILDEFGYIPLNIDGGRLLFRVISQSYETRSLIITTNLEFGHWGSVFSDDKIAAAAVDRLVHHGRLVEFRGNSRRMDNSLMLGNSKE